MILWLLAAGPLFADPRVERAIAKIFADGPRNEITRRLDTDIVEHLTRDLTRLSEERREYALSVLENVRFGEPVRSERSVSYAELLSSPVETILVLRGRPSEKLRVMFEHELAHLLRFAGRNALETYARAWALRRERRFGILREEIHAFRRVHRFVRRNYVSDNVWRLEFEGERELAWIVIEISIRAEAKYVKRAVRNEVYLSAQRDADRERRLRPWRAFSGKCRKHLWEEPRRRWRELAGTKF